MNYTFIQLIYPYIHNTLSAAYQPAPYYHGNNYSCALPTHLSSVMPIYRKKLLPIEKLCNALQFISLCYVRVMVLLLTKVVSNFNVIVIIYNKTLRFSKEVSLCAAFIHELDRLMDLFGLTNKLNL